MNTARSRLMNDVRSCQHDGGSDPSPPPNLDQMSRGQRADAPPERRTSTEGWRKETGVELTTDLSAPQNAPNTELLRSLARLVRGLSALFWGLPITLIICVETAKTEMLRTFGIAPPVAVTAWLVFGLWQLGHFQKQERIWINALERAKMLAVADLGLSPFLYWWNQVPGEPFYTAVVGVMAVCGLLFLSDLNLVLYRLSAMLPDEHLRQETKQFTTLNRFLVLGILFLGIFFFMALRFPAMLPSPAEFLERLGSGGLWLMVFLVLLPLALTMALLWKIKEAILDSVFGAGR
jgi:hypothetical protein